MNKPSKRYDGNQGRGEYRDVRWMELRNSILIRDGYKCQACKGVEDLQVHHVKYVRGGKIWDSPAKDLVTLCRECHKKVHEVLKTYLAPPKGRHNAKGKRGGSVKKIGCSRH
jgi:5-methylcytosine-specific restriction endonuclease McrA